MSSLGSTWSPYREFIADGSDAGVKSARETNVLTTIETIHAYQKNFPVFDIQSAMQLLSAWVTFFHSHAYKFDFTNLAIIYGFLLSSIK